MASSLSVVRLVAIRAAHHPEATPKYDRVVFECDGLLPSLRVEYVKQIIASGSGLPVAVKGDVLLQVRLEPAQAHTDAGQTTAPLRLAPNLPIVKEIVSAGDFEGLVTYGIGLARKAELRIMTMAAPNRLVIDMML